jgi:hypothetical protein
MLGQRASLAESDEVPALDAVAVSCRAPVNGETTTLGARHAYEADPD